MTKAQQQMRKFREREQAERESVTKNPTKKVKRSASASQGRATATISSTHDSGDDFEQPALSGVQVKKRTTASMHSCYYCKEFFTDEDYDEHKKTHYVNCPHCPKFFSNKTNLKRHISTAHGKDLLE